LADEFAFLGVRALGEQIRRGDVSVEEIVRATLARIARVDPHLHSFITVAGDRAIDSARHADIEIHEGRYRGPLHGIPVGIKDHIDTAGIETTAGSRLYAGRVPHKDAIVVRKLKEAGAIIIGKANMNPFAAGDSGWNPDFGQIKNPRQPDASVGGSSGGSGAQVAAGLVPLSIGSDNGGSIRIPAALCGIVGIKPTFGRVSADGVAPRSFSTDHIGPLGRTVDDVAVVLEAISGHAAGSSTTFGRPVPPYATDMAADVRGLRIGVDRAYCNVGDSTVLDAFHAALRQIEELGCSFHEISMPAIDEVFQVDNTIFQPEVLVYCEAVIRQFGAKTPAVLREDNAFAHAVSAYEYLCANQRRRAIQVSFARAIRDLDLVVSPTYFLARRPFPPTSDMLAGGYPAIGSYAPQFVDAMRYTLPFNLLGLPAITVPCSITERGCVGLQIAGRAWEEVAVLRLARAFEEATPWHGLPPPDL